MFSGNVQRKKTKIFKIPIRLLFDYFMRHRSNLTIIISIFNHTQNIYRTFCIASERDDPNKVKLTQSKHSFGLLKFESLLIESMIQRRVRNIGGAPRRTLPYKNIHSSWLQEIARDQHWPSEYDDVCRPLAYRHTIKYTFDAIIN